MTSYTWQEGWAVWGSVYLVNSRELFGWLWGLGGRMICCVVCFVFGIFFFFGSAATVWRESVYQELERHSL